MEHHFKVNPGERGMRLDSFLYRKMGDWSHKKIKQAIDEKRVRVNGKNVFISGWNLKGGDAVILCPPRPYQPRGEAPSRYHFVDVLFEDNDLLVTNKPPFMDYDSYVVQVSAYLKRRHGKTYHPYLGQMHRLDKETSGILLFTKKKKANVLADQFREHRIKKYYLALVLGQVQQEQGIINNPIEKGKFEGGKKARVIHPRVIHPRLAEEGEGKESHTEYRVRERYENATLLDITLKTGRTHQIRVHTASLGHPVMGDKLYGGQNQLAKRQMLHAQRIELEHPVTRKKMKFEAPLPEDMAKMIDRLRG